MTLENSRAHNSIRINDNDTQKESTTATTINDKMVVSNLHDSTSPEASSSSRRKKGKPQKCIESTLANGNADNLQLPSTTTSSLLGESNRNVSNNDDSGIEASFNSLVASLFPSTSSSIANPESFFLPVEEMNPAQLLQQFEASLHGTIPNFRVTNSAKRKSSSPSSMQLPKSASTKPSLNDIKAAQLSTPTSSNKRKIKRVNKIEPSIEEQPVTLPEGFERLLEKVKAEPISASDLNGTNIISNAITSSSSSRPASANEMDLLLLSCPPKKKREIGRCETKATVQAADGTILEGNYDAQELHEFVKQFKILRNKYGFTQGDVGAALGKRYGADFSQTTISRFEALNLSYKNMCKLRPLLEEWLEDIEKALERGIPIQDLLTMSNFDSDSTSMSGSNSPESRLLQPVHVPKLNAKIVPPLKKRRKRTNLDPQQKMALDTYFVMNPRPDYAQINEIGNTLNLDNDVIRVWFCNRRQKIRKTEE